MLSLPQALKHLAALRDIHLQQCAKWRRHLPAPFGLTQRGPALNIVEGVCPELAEALNRPKP